MEKIINAMRAPSCKAPLERKQDQLLAGDEVIFRIKGSEFILVESEKHSEVWQSRQEDSIARYQRESYNSISAIPRLFGYFIAATHCKGQLVLDIGCGISRVRPLYAQLLPKPDYLGLEPLKTQSNREYPCLVGAVCESIPLADSSIDTVVFATSLDHIENLDGAREEVKRVLKPGGNVLIWTGLYDPEIMAHAKTFFPIVYGGSMLRRVLRGVLLFVDYFYFLYRTYDRKRKLKNGHPIDNVHFKYYTLKSIEKELTDWGFTVDQKIVVPGSTSMFLKGILLTKESVEKE